jgi:hypothetical protein
VDPNTKPDRIPARSVAAGGEHAAVSRTLKKKVEPFEYKDKGTMATIGRKAAVVQFRRGRSLTGTTAWLAWGTVHLALLSTGGRAKAVVTGPAGSRTTFGPIRCVNQHGAVDPPPEASTRTATARGLSFRPLMFIARTVPSVAIARVFVDGGARLGRVCCSGCSGS